MMKKAQFWYADFLIGLLILVFISILFIKTITDLNTKEDTIQNLLNDGISISNSFMSKGYLSDQWVNTQGRIGIADNGKINNIDFNNLKALNYKTSKTLLGVSNDYAIYIEYTDGSISDWYSKPGIFSISGINSDSIIKVTRFAYYNGRLAKLVIVVW